MEKSGIRRASNPNPCLTAIRCAVQIVILHHSPKPACHLAQRFGVRCLVPEPPFRATAYPAFSADPA